MDQQGSVLSRTVEGVRGLIGYSLKMLVLVHLGIDVVVGLGLAAVCYLIAHDGSMARGMLASFVATAAAFGLATLVATHIAVFLAIARAVQQVELGRLVFESLFERLLSVTSCGVAEDSMAGRVHGMRFTELQARLTQAADRLPLSWVAAAGLPGRLAQWLANKVQQVVVWTTVRVIMSNSRSESQDGAKGDCIDLVALRDRLAGRVDGCLIDYLRGHVTRFAFAVAGLIIAGACVGAYVIRQLPI